jgi:hypothetical protein
MTVIDVSVPSQPRQVGYYDTPGNSPQAPLAVADGYAYLYDSHRIRVVDVADPVHPTEIGNCRVSGIVYGLSISNAYLYVAAGDCGLQILDVSDPAHPAEVAQYSLGDPQQARAVTVSGGLACVTDGCTGLRLIDVSDPTNPAEIGRYDVPGGAVGLAVEGQYAYVGAALGGLRVIDISDPTTPVEAGYCAEPGVGYCDIAVDGGFAYVVNSLLVEGGLRIVDVSDPAHPTVVGEWGDIRSRYPAAVAVVGTQAYVALGLAGLCVLDMSDTSHPVEVGRLDTPGTARCVAQLGDYAYVGDDSGLRVLDVTDPAGPIELGHFYTSSIHGLSDAYAVAVTPGYAYVATPYSGLRVLDVSDPADPTEIGCLETSSPIYDLRVASGYAYIAQGQWGLAVVDISAPTQPVMVGSCDTPDYAWGVTIAGGYAYVAAAASGLRIIDVADPSHPREVGYWDTPGFSYAVAVSGQYAYVADTTAGLRIINVADPVHPVEVGYYAPARGYVYDVAVAGPYAYLASGSSLRIIDVSDPARPVEVAYWDTPGAAQAVTVANGYVLLPDYWWGLLIFPEYPRIVSAPDLVACPGSTLAVPIQINDATGVAAAQIDFRYDPQILTGTSVEAGNLIAGQPGWQLFSQIEPGRTQAIIYNDRAQALPGGSGSLVVVTFQVNPAATQGQVSPLTLAKHLLSDAAGNELPSQGQDGSVTVIPVHHFLFDSIVSPQGGDLTHPLPFQVRVEARDASNALVSTYNGTADLSSSVGTAAPPTIGFTNGIGQVEVTILADLDPDCTLTVTDAGVPASGTSNIFALRGKGDPTNDGAVNVLDVMRTVNIVLSNPVPQPPRYEFQYWAANMNSDGAVNVQDIILIINKIFSAAGLGAAQPLAAQVQASTTPVVVDAAWSTSASGNPVLSVMLSDAAGVAGAQLDVTYNSKRVSDVMVSAGGLIASAPGWSIYSRDAGGRARVVAFNSSAQGLTGGAGSVAVLEFASRGKGNLADIAEVILTDAAGNRIPTRIGAPGKPGKGVK